MTNPLIGQPTRSGLLIPKANSDRSSRFAAADEADRRIAFVRAAGIGHLRRANWPISGFVNDRQGQKAPGLPSLLRWAGCRPQTLGIKVRTQRYRSGHGELPRSPG